MELNEMLKIAVHTLDSHKGEELLALHIPHGTGMNTHKDWQAKIPHF